MVVEEEQGAVVAEAGAAAREERGRIAQGWQLQIWWQEANLATNYVATQYGCR